MPTDRRTPDGVLLRAGLDAVFQQVAAMVPDGRHATLVLVYDKATGTKIAGAAKLGTHVAVDLVVGLEGLQPRELVFRLQGVW